MKVVLLPGLDGTGILFKPFIEALSGDIEAQVIPYPPNKKMSYPELVNFVLAKLPSECFILVAESFSGPIAYQVALKKPEHLLSVIFVATFLTPPKKKLLNLTQIIPTRLFLKVSIPNVIIKKYLFGSSVGQEIISLFEKSLKIVSSGVLSFRLGEISNLKGNIIPCNIKATYIQATDDKLVSISSLEAFKKVCKNLTIFRIEGTHFILQTNPSACAGIIENEIRKLNE